MTFPNASMYSGITTTNIIIATPIDDESHFTGMKYRSILIYVTIDSMTPPNASTYSGITTTIIITTPIDDESQATGIKYRSHNTAMFISLQVVVLVLWLV